MSTPSGNPASPANEPPPPPAPLISPTGNASVDALASAVNAGAQPFQQLGNPKANTLDRVTNVVSGAVGSLGALDQLLNTGMAMIPGANLVPGMPAAFIGVPHLGVPHAHAHPPSDGVPMPSCGMTIGSGCLSVLYGGMPAARVLDIGLAPTCGGFAPIFEICTGSSNTFIGGARAARMALDLTRHCNPLGMSGAGHAAQEAEKASALKRAMHIAGMAAPVASGGLTATDQAVDGAGAAAVEMTAAQTAADAIAMAMSNLMGKDPGVEPGMGTLIEGDASVLIGGFPMPDALAMLMLGWGLRKKAKEPAEEPKRTNEGPCKDGHPVDVVMGTAENTFVDYETRVAPAFKWERYYCSGWSDRDGELGFGFRHVLQHELRLLRTRAIYVDGQNREYPIRCNRAGRYEGVFAGYGLEQRSINRFVLRHGAQGELTFERTSEVQGTARLVRHLRDGVESGFRYASDGTLRHVEQMALRGGRSQLIDFIYDAHGHVIEVRLTDAQGTVSRIARYRYDAAGCLVTSTNALGASMTYGYDNRRRMIRETDANGYSFSYRYDSDSRCVESVGQDGMWRVVLDYQPGRTVVTRADGGKWTFLYNKSRTVTRVVDPYGGATDRLIGPDGRIVQEIDSGGRKVRWLYDERGRNTGRMDRWGKRWPPWDEVATLPNALVHTVPDAPLALQWGDVEPSELAGTVLLSPQVEQLVSASRPMAPTTSAHGDAVVHQRAQTDESERARHIDVDSVGNVLRLRDRDGRDYRYAIASFNLRQSETDPLGNTVSYRYTAKARIAAIVDANGNESLYTYDLKNRISSVMRHGVVRETYTYDIGDRLIEKKDATGEVLLRFEVGSNGLHSKRILASGATHSYEYDARGKFTKASTDRFDVTLAYDTRGRRIADLRDGLGVQHAYIDGSLCSTTYFERFVVRYEAHGKSDDVHIQDPCGGVHGFARAADGRILLRLGNGRHWLYQFDAEGRCVERLGWTEGAASPVHCVHYQYSPFGELRAATDSANGATRYEYDAAHRLTGEFRNGWPVRHFKYDRGGNLLSTPTHQWLSCVEGNRLTSTVGVAYRYDHRNHLSESLSKHCCTAYRYDSLDMLVEVTSSDWDGAWRAEYDGLCRRCAKTLGQRRTEYYWDGDRLAAERGPDGRLRIYVYVNETAFSPFMFIDYASLDAAPESGAAYFVLCNQVGLPERIEDKAWRVVWEAAEIDPYGAIEVAAGNTVDYALRWPGHYFDSETGLHDNRFRSYSPRLGRYLQSDPAGQSGGVNLYAYPANPLISVDVFGLTGGGTCDGQEASDENDNQKKPDRENPDAGTHSDEPDPAQVTISGVCDNPHEEVQARRFGEILGGGEFKFPERDASGAYTKGRQGIEGYFETPDGKNIPVSLKDLDQPPKNVFRTIRENAGQIKKAALKPPTDPHYLPPGTLGQTIVHVQARNLTTQEITDFLDNSKPNVFPQDPFKEIIIDTNNGVVRIFEQGGVMKHVIDDSIPPLGPKP
ncbi:RHS repeat-associated core domain-containing protein [Paraburkholderia nodosa]|uniref:RHS repeat-associated core domain-containing protein n=1 Tax=Paraburkholderia nodosa TaxID=392320 RepID=UPI0004B704AE|nr:RHS repeat-associated core domain-containing protein [Paraburkholderia nodosa]